jgi:hypothetical protein
MDQSHEELFLESQKRVRVLERELAQCHDAVSALRSSSSWRITAPLRFASRVLGPRTLKNTLLKLFHQWSAIRTIARSGLFDRKWYLANNPDVAQSGLDPIEHYVRYGASEGRDPSPVFSTQGYLAEYSDVASAGVSPLEHFIRQGVKEGRRAVPRSENRMPGTEQLVADPTISAYIQCYSHKAALYQTLSSFRKYYSKEPITLISDRGEDFSQFAKRFGLFYYRSEKNCDPRGNLGKDGALEYLDRIYQHCLRVASDYVVILEEDVITQRRIQRFPHTHCGGPRFNILADPLNQYLREINNTTETYGYAMCGGSIFNREVYIKCYERRSLDLNLLESLDKRVVQYSDVVLTVIFLVNGYSYGIWEEVSESNHPVEELRIFRDAAFDHNDKKWYGVEFDEALLNQQS